MSNCELFLQNYLKMIGIEDATITASQDNIGYLIVLSVPRHNNEKIGVLKGKNGRNMLLLKQLTRVIGFLEKKNPFIVIKLVD